MGSGCLRPPASVGHIDISILDTIYEDIKQYQPSSPSTSSQQSCEIVYRQLQARIHKKGHLKKLVDYLSSHRSRLCDVVMHSYRITGQSKNLNFKYVAIVILQGLFNSIPKNESAHQQHFGVQNKSMSGNISGRSSNIQNVTIEQKQNTFNDIRKVLVTEISETEQKALKSVSLIQQLTSYKFESIYLNFVILLLKEGGFIYKLILDNLVRFSQFSHLQFGNQIQVFQIMKIIYNFVQVHEYLHLSLEAYRALLLRARESFFIQNSDALVGFMELWGQQNNSGHGLSTKECKVGDECQKIIEVFIRKNIESYQYDIVAQTIILVLDANKFTNSHKIQNLLENCTFELELKNQFNRSLISHLLCYIGFPQNHAVENRVSLFRLNSKIESRLQSVLQDESQKNMNVVQREWVNRFKRGSPLIYRNKFKYVISGECKLNSLGCLCRWIFDSIGEIDQLIQYSGLKLIYSYTFNMLSHMQPVRDKAVAEFINFVSKLSKANKIVVLGIMMAQLQQSQIFDDGIIFTYLNICETVLDKEKYLQIAPNQQNIIQLCNLGYCYENNLKILELNSKIFSKFRKEDLGRNLERISKFYYSIYKEVLIGFSSCDQKITIIDEMIAKLETIPAFFKGVHCAFLQVIGDQGQKQNNPDGITETTQFFSDLFIVRFTKLIQSVQKNQSIENYLEKLKKKRDLQQLALLELYNQQRIPLTNKIKVAKESLNFYEQSLIFFRKCQTKEIELVGSESHFWKDGKSINSHRDSVYEKDKDLEDVLQIVRN